MNGDEINDRLEFQERIKKLPPEERSLETALMVFDLTRKVDCLNVRGDKRISAVTSGIVASVIVGIAEGLKILFGRG